MKKVLLGAVIVAMFASCNKSLEDKANALIEEDIRKDLYHPETYDPAETQVDSAFTPFDDPVFYEKTAQLYQLAKSIDECNSEMKRAKSSMAIWSGPYQTAYDRNEYQEAKKEYNENVEKKKKAERKIEKLSEELKAMLKREHQFIGFKARHRYRADTNAGQTVFGNMEYLFDKDMSEIIASYDMDDEEYKAVHSFYRQILEEDIIEGE